MPFPDWVTAGLRIAHLGRSSVRYEVALFRNDDDTAACEGFFVHVYVRRADHRPAAIDPARRDALGHLLSDRRVEEPDFKAESV